VPVTGTTAVPGTITVSTTGGTVAVTWFAEGCPAELADGSDPKALNNKPVRTKSEIKIGFSFMITPFGILSLT
jgi:hypothetical protein